MSDELYFNSTDLRDCDVETNVSTLTANIEEVHVGEDVVVESIEIVIEPVSDEAVSEDMVVNAKPVDASHAIPASSTDNKLTSLNPDDLAKERIWVGFKLKKDKDEPNKINKIPINPMTGGYAKANDPTTYGTLEEARKAVKTYGLDGVSILIAKEFNLVGIDIDDCVDPETDKINDFAKGIINSLNSYSEYSISGSGIHIICVGELPDGRKKNDTLGLEMYCEKRFFTVSGKQIAGTPKMFEERTAEIKDVFFKYMGTKGDTVSNTTIDKNSDTCTLTDEAVIQHILNSNNVKLIGILQGNWQRHYKSQSQADMALANVLAFYMGKDFKRMDRLFRNSPLFRDKWERNNNGKTYGELLLTKAIRECKTVYVPNYYKHSVCEEYDEAVLYPQRMGSEALYGITGEVVEALEPNTEAYLEGIVVCFLTEMGNILDNVYFSLGASGEHYTNMFSVLVGSTASRKGTTCNCVECVTKPVDYRWFTNNVKSGLSSGEGVTWSVRDAIYKRVPVFSGKGKDKIITGYEDKKEDEGIKDKRLLIIEPEFASMLKMMKRQGNTLSPTIRNAWDKKNLEILSKNSPCRATNPHISIIAQITREELVDNLSKSDISNGFANRFLFACVKRSKYLPICNDIPVDVMNKLVNKLSSITTFVKSGGRVDFDKVDFEDLPDDPPADINNKIRIKFNDEVTKAWVGEDGKEGIYKTLSKEVGGSGGEFTARSSVHVIRLATLYAVLDKSLEIRMEHMKAALAVWKYCEESAKYIFGRTKPSGIEDKICNALKNGQMSKTEIHQKVFKKNLSADQINEALDKLLADNLIERNTTKTGGKDKTVWSLQKV